MAWLVQWSGWFACFWAMAYAGFLQWQMRQLRLPLMVIEPVEDEIRPDRVNVAITIRNRGPRDIYLHTVALVAPALMMKRRDGHFLDGDDWDRPDHSGRELGWGARLTAYASGEFPSAVFSFWVDGVPADLRDFSIAVSVSRKISASDVTVLRCTLKIKRSHA